MSTFPLVLLVFAGIAGYRAYLAGRASLRARSSWLRGLESSATTPAELVAMAEAARTQVGVGTFRALVSVTGEATGAGRPGPVSGRPALWFRERTLRHYRGSKGAGETETTGEYTGGGPFRLVDGAAEVTVDPSGADVRAAERVERHERPDPDEGISLGPVRIGGSTTGHTRQEWRLAPGTRVTVIGEARDTGTEILLAVRPDQALTITRTDRSDHVDAERRKARESRTRAVAWGLGAIVVAVLAFAVL